MMTAEWSRIVIRAAHAEGVRLPAHSTFRIVDDYGGQVGDLFIFALDGSKEFVSAAHTRIGTGRLFPEVGQTFLSNGRRALATVLEDSEDGKHDMLCAACDSERYRLLGAVNHRNCTDNLIEAAAKIGFDLPCVPQPVNVFMRVSTERGRVRMLPSVSRPGSRLVLRAHEPVAVFLSSCPQDLTDISHRRLTDLVIEYLSADPESNVQAGRGF